jgi:hypothetical protein
MCVLVALSRSLSSSSEKKSQEMKKKGDRVGEIDDCVTSKGIVEEKLAHKKARLDNVVEEFDKSME